MDWLSFAVAMLCVATVQGITYDECLECSDLLVESPWGEEIFNVGQLKTGCSLGFACGESRPLCRIGRRMRNNKEFELDGDDLRCGRFGGVDFQIRHLTEAPTFAPSFPPTTPTSLPTEEATAEPTVEPTAEPTVEPTVGPTVEPTVEPTAEPTVEPTVEPTAEPTVEPTTEPTTGTPTAPGETSAPSFPPTNPPTSEPTAEPTQPPSSLPTVEPTSLPTAEPTTLPTPPPIPTASPTLEPTSSPVTPVPTASPTNRTEVSTGEQNTVQALGTGGIVMVSAVGAAGFVMAATLLFVGYRIRKKRLAREKAQREEWNDSLRKDILGAPAKRVRYTFTTNDDFTESGESAVTAHLAPPPQPSARFPEYREPGDLGKGSFDSFFDEYQAEFGEETEHRSYPMDL